MRFQVKIKNYGGLPRVMVIDTSTGAMADYWAGRPTRFKLWRARCYAASLNRHVRESEG